MSIHSEFNELEQALLSALFILAKNPLLLSVSDQNTISAIVIRLQNKQAALQEKINGPVA